jgi:hypothetical protein
MNSSNTPFTEVYAQWLDSFRAMIPGSAPAQKVVEKKAEVVAKQEWEDEGGNLKQVPPAKTKGAPKLRSRKKPAAAPKRAAKKAKGKKKR